MSAYIVDRVHIEYLVAAAMSRRIRGHGSHAFRWYHNGESHELACGDYARAAEVGQMLWDECVASVSARYPHEDVSTLPGPIGETYQYGTHRPRPMTFEPVQVIKAAHCYDYQSCEHEGWEGSESYAFIHTLVTRATCELPGYDAAAWGAPVSKAAQAWAGGPQPEGT